MRQPYRSFRSLLEDPDHVVRLEAVLALKRTATGRAKEALDRLNEARPDEADVIDPWV
jgi:HEAT repeat protein